MRNLDKYFENKTIDYEKLLKYGFSKNGNNYIYENKIYNDSFNVIVEITKEKKSSKVIDLSTNEEYTLIDVKHSTGNYVGKIKEEYEFILNDIIENCTTPNIFKSKQAKYIIKYIKEKYNDDLEFLWEKFSNTAVWRNKNNNKWYGLILILPENKLGLESNKIVEVIDLRYQKNDINNIVDKNKIFPGYHMNKKSWITIRLDESVEIKEIYKLIDNSYKISLKK